MKLFSVKNHKEAQDPFQLDFLADFHELTPTMKPIEPSPDGTPPLPLLNQPQSIPPRPVFSASHTLASDQNVTPLPATADKAILPANGNSTDPGTAPGADVFESDPFFNPPPPQEDPGFDTIVTAPPEEDVFIPGNAPSEVKTPEVPAQESAPPTAEERLLGTINASKETRKAVIARDKPQQEAQAFKTRISALEIEIVAARAALNQANQVRGQTELRFEKAEKEWTDKLSHLRHMLDEVEDTRDEVFQKRVPRLLLIGTLVAGIIATIFAYLIGASQTARSPVTGANQPIIPASASAPVFEPISKANTPSEQAPNLAAPAAPVLMPEVAAIEPSPPPPLKAPPTHPARAATAYHPQKPANPIPGKPVTWPTLSGSRWSTTAAAKEMKVVFHYGIFSKGAELTSAARQDLKAIAATLAGKSFQVEVEGHTDSVKSNRAKASGANNQALGLARAKAVAAYLSGSCGLPESIITTSSAGEAHPPYPNTTTANQQRNRTVILRITAR